MAGRPIHIVVAGTPVVLGAYTNADSAHLHARVIQGVSVVGVDLVDQVPPEIREDIYQAEISDFDDDDATPVDQEPVPPPTRRR